MKKIFTSDYTLRDCAKRAEAVSFREKNNIAKCLDDLGVDAIELAPLNGSKEDAIIVRTISMAVKNAAVCIPVGFTTAEVDAAWECVKDAEKPILQVMVPTSTVQMEYTYHLKDDRMALKIAELVAYAKGKCNRVEFIASDASRADRSFLLKACTIAVDAGATAVALHDDAGIMAPKAFGAMAAEVKAAVGKVKVFVSPSDAIHMAAACALEALSAGADGVKTTITGEGTLNLAKFADTIRVLGGEVEGKWNLDHTGIHRAVAAFAPGGKGVVEAMVEEQQTLLLTAESTLGDIAKAVYSLGYDLSEEDTGKVYEEFKRVTAKRDSVSARELEAMVASSAMQVPSTYHLESYVCNSGNTIRSLASVTLTKDGAAIQGVSVGDGPIDASFRAIEQAMGHHYELDDFQIQAVTEGREALGAALVKLRSGGKLYSGNGLSTDIVAASIRAYINALNKIVYEEN